MSTRAEIEMTMSRVRVSTGYPYLPMYPVVHADAVYRKSVHDAIKRA